MPTYSSFYIGIDEAQFFDDGIIEVSKIVFPYAIILTQECDLTHDFTFRFNKQKNGDKILLSVLAAPIYNAEHVSNGEHLSQIRDRPMQEIKMKHMDARR